MQTKDNAVTDFAQQILNQVRSVVVGKDQVLLWVLAAILAKGHILLEDIPGVGKTTMALAFSKVLDLRYSRVQFTPDVLPSDITGFSVYRKETGTFAYHPGAVMCNLFLADEINRTTPKTQSALLEVMEEGSVTVDGVTRPVPDPFFVIATENPLGSAGTQMLPESQLDRFMICTAMGYPETDDEIRILTEQALDRPLSHVRTVITRAQLLQMQQEVSQIFTHPVIYKYIVELSRATRQHPCLALGLSPRASLAAASMARATAYLKGRSYVLPDDVLEVFPDVARHRLRLSGQAQAQRKHMDQVLKEILTSVRKPRPENAHEK